MTNEFARAYELFHSIKLTNQLPWWEFDVRANKVVTSPKKVTMLGYDPDDFVDIGYQAFTDLLHPDDYEPAMQAMRDHLEGKAPLYQIDYRIRRKSGDYTWYFDRGAILDRDENGAPVMLRGVVLDLGPDLHKLSHDEAVVTAIRELLPTAGGEGAVVLCAQCGRMRTGADQWTNIGPDIRTGLAGELSHMMCNDCIHILYPEEADQIITRLRKYTR